jgi:serine/threonine protein kinase
MIKLTKNSKMSLCKICLVDFGTAKFFENEDIEAKQTFCGTPHFMAPEVYGQRYGPSVDLYSCGITLLHCYFGDYTPYKTLEEYKNIWYWTCSSKNVDKKSKQNEFVEKIFNLTKTVETRSTLEAALESFWYVDSPTQEQSRDFVLAAEILHTHYSWAFLHHQCNTGQKSGTTIMDL